MADVPMVNVPMADVPMIEHRKADRRLALRLAGFAAFLFALYLVFGFVVPQTPGRLGRPSAALIGELELWRWATELGLPVPRSGVGVAVLVVGLAGLAFASYGVALRTCWKRSGTAGLAVAMAAAIAFAVVSIGYLPNLSSDIFNYIMRGRMVAVHGENPYYVAVDHFPGDPLYPYTSPEYRHAPGEKLPAWMLVNVMLARLGSDDPVRALLTYRTAFMLFHVGSLVLIAALLKRTSPQLQLAGVIAYGWNPIIALHAQNKTDTVMVFFLLAAVQFLAVGRRRIALVPLVLSAFVKLITLPLVAIALLGHLRARRWRTLLLDAVVVLGTAGAIYLPFARDAGLVVRQLGLEDIRAAASGAAHVTAGAGQVSSRFVPHLGLVPLLLWFGFVLWVGLARETTWIPRLRRWAIVTFLLVVLFSKLEFSWYLMTPLALASLAGSGPLTAMVVFVCSSSFLFNVWQSAAASGFELPHVLVDVPRAAVHLGFAAAAALLVLAIVLVPGRRRRWAARGGHGPASTSSYRS